MVSRRQPGVALPPGSEARYREGGAGGQDVVIPRTSRKDGGVAWEVSIMAAAETLDGFLMLPGFLQELHPLLPVITQLGLQKLDLEDK